MSPEEVAPIPRPFHRTPARRRLVRRSGGGAGHRPVSPQPLTSFRIHEVTYFYDQSSTSP